MTNTVRPRVFSGIQPTGELHLGNYLGAVRRWARMLDEYECFFCVVDLHAITLPYEADQMPERVFDLAVSLMAAGLDPDRCTLFVQSDVPEHAELAWLLNTVTPLGDLQRMTQFKDKAGRAESVDAGLLNYPVLQAADILLYRAGLVPVGEDQRQHLELTREVARRWNARFGDFFPEPEALIAEGARVLGLDGATKMSKSQNNTIPMLASPEELHRIIGTAVTDPARVTRRDPGNPNVCNVFALHGFFSTRAEVDEVEIRCQTATHGCVECKRWLAGNVAAELAPVRERAEALRADPDRVYEILEAGAERARGIARETIREAYARMGLRRRVSPMAALGAGGGREGPGGGAGWSGEPGTSRGGGTDGKEEGGEGEGGG